MIFEGSRYEFSPLIRVLTGNKELLPALYQDTRLLKRRFVFQEHVWSVGDRIDLLAARFLGDSDRWWVIMLANPEITDPDTIEPTTVIRIPRE